MKLSIKKSIPAFTLFLAVLLSNSALAKQQDGQQDGCLKLKELRSDYDAVTKGTRMFVQLKFHSHDCHLLLDSASSNVLLVEPRSGLDLKTYDRSYSKIKKSEKSPTGRMADEMKLTVLVTITSDLAPGKYEIPAVLNYQAVDGKDDVVQQSTTLVIPVQVVASAAQVHFKKEPDRLEPLKITGAVAVGIVLLPIFVAMGIVQLITGFHVLPDC
jgi:hypothetical protein